MLESELVLVELEETDMLETLRVERSDLSGAKLAGSKMFWLGAQVFAVVNELLLYVDAFALEDEVLEPFDTTRFVLEPELLESFDIMRRRGGRSSGSTPIPLIVYYL